MGGGTAGHNGLRSVEAHLGNEFRRVRIGIGHPGHKDRVTGHVLGNYAKAELEPLADTLGAAIQVSVKGENSHHMVEACFKGVGRALRQAFRREGDDLPTTKGVL